MNPAAQPETSRSAIDLKIPEYCCLDGRVDRGYCRRITVIRHVEIGY